MKNSNWCINDNSILWGKKKGRLMAKNMLKMDEHNNAENDYSETKPDEEFQDVQTLQDNLHCNSSKSKISNILRGWRKLKSEKKQNNTDAQSTIFQQAEICPLNETLQQYIVGEEIWNAAEIENELALVDKTIKSLDKSSDKKTKKANNTSDAKSLYQCTYCPKQFGRRDTMKEHIRTHTKEKPFACQFCTMVFPTQSTKRKHEQTHIGEKNYECSNCGLRFSGKPSLNYHMMVHSGERPFKCAHCGKGFIQNSHLRRHIRVHTGEKPFSCSYCKVKFVRSSSLKNHIRSRHTGEVLFQCHHCEKQFYAKETFEYHLKAHLGIKPFSCELCGWAFIKNSHLKRHLRIHNEQFSSTSLDFNFSDKKTIGYNLMQMKSSTKNQVHKDQSASETVAPTMERNPRRWSYTCTYCPKQFAHKRSLENHLKFHVVMEQKAAKKLEKSPKKDLLSNGVNSKVSDEDMSNDSDKVALLLCDVHVGDAECEITNE